MTYYLEMIYGIRKIFEDKIIENNLEDVVKINYYVDIISIVINSDIISMVKEYVSDYRI